MAICRADYWKSQCFTGIWMWLYRCHLFSLPWAFDSDMHQMNEGDKQHRDNENGFISKYYVRDVTSIIYPMLMGSIRDRSENINFRI